MKKFIILGLILLLFTINPAPVVADTVAGYIAELQAQIAALQEQIRVLQNQQRDNFCYDFREDFGLGKPVKHPVDPELTALYKILQNEGFNTTELGKDETGFGDLLLPTFGQNYLNLVKKFQTKYGIPATGYVGPLTRAKLNSLYGCRNATGDLVLSGTFGPTSLAVGETGIWKIFVRSQNNSSLNYQINWGDNLPVASSLQPIAGTTMSTPQETSFSHAYGQPGTYTISFTVSDTSGHQVSGTMSVVIRPQAGPGLKVLSPNGGENWVANSVQDIRWQTVAGAVPKVDLYLTHRWPCEIENDPGNCAVPMIYVADWQAPILLDRNIDVNTAYHWIVATDINNKTISSGTYVIEVCAAGSRTNCDSSDHVFTISPQYLPSSGASTTHN